MWRRDTTAATLLFGRKIPRVVTAAQTGSVCQGQDDGRTITDAWANPVSNSRSAPSLPPPLTKFYKRWEDIPEAWRDALVYVGELHLKNVPTRFWFREIIDEPGCATIFSYVVMDTSQRVEGIVLEREFALSQHVGVSQAVPYLYMPWKPLDPDAALPKGGAV